MTLAHPFVLHFLWLLPLVGLILLIRRRRARKALERFCDPELLSRLVGAAHPGRAFFRDLLLLGALALMLLALAGPRWGSHFEEVSQKGVDILLVVDTSTSMLVEDVNPNRLERAKREIRDFLRVVQGDRVGLVAFSGTAFLQCPLTLDYAALEMFLSALTPELIPVPGTDLGAALDTALAAFDDRSPADKVILLITDGEDHEGKGKQAARAALQKGVKIYIFGLGDANGGPIPGPEGKGGFRKDQEGNLVLSRLNEEGLRAIASLTGGRYARSVAGDLDLDTLYFEGIKTETEAAVLKSGKIKVYEERCSLFVVSAFFLLAMEGLIRSRKTLGTPQA